MCKTCETEQSLIHTFRDAKRDRSLITDKVLDEAIEYLEIQQMLRFEVDPE